MLAAKAITPFPLNLRHQTPFMRVVPAAASALLAILLITILNSKMLLPAPLGPLLAPQQGFWQNAEKTTENFSGSISNLPMTGKAEIYFDERLVPHVFAANTGDACFAQGFLHAKFRLFQMQLQTMAAAGRASEIIGAKALNHDREFRRLGMVWGARKTLAAVESNPETKAAFDAYTAGVNAFIGTLTPASTPLEFKMLGIKPERWTNLHSALFLKYMAYDLSSFETDFETTKARDYFSPADFKLLFPDYQDSLDPIIEKGTPQIPPSLHPMAPADSSVRNVATSELFKTDPANGSNNWAVGPSKSASGYPILCNDPHLALNLPSLWYEIQLHTPAFSAYGASFPGAPGVIIGFNDSIAFGFTNGGRDVRDYYKIRFKDRSKKEYWFNNAWKKTELHYDTIHIAGEKDFIDTVAYTVFGPVMYDESFNGSRSDSVHAYAVRWKGQDGSNDPLLFLHLDKAKNYADYVQAAQHLETPGQNIVFAAKNGDIALRTQGVWPAKWEGQGDVIMPGEDSSFMWQGMIPQNEVPYMFNPARGFVSSANQRPLDSSYSYYLGKNYPVDRGKTLNRLLAGQEKFTVQDMMRLQQNTFDYNAAELMPLIVKHMPALGANAQHLFREMAAWNYYADAGSRAATIYYVFYPNFYNAVFSDEYAGAPKGAAMPIDETLPEALLRDTTFPFLDDIKTAPPETLSQMLARAMEKTAADFAAAKGPVAWGAYKQSRIYHLTKIPFLSSPILNLDGSGASLNANKMNAEAKQAHGPSWRMIVHLAPQTEAYGIYPGGQSGNPGSRFYQSSVHDWAAGKYYKLWMMQPGETADTRIIGHLTLSK